MAKQTKTQSFNADTQTMTFIINAKKYGIAKDRLIRKAIESYYKIEIQPYENRLMNRHKAKEYPW